MYLIHQVATKTLHTKQVHKKVHKRNYVGDLSVVSITIEIDWVQFTHRNWRCGVYTRSDKCGLENTEGPGVAPLASSRGKETDDFFPNNYLQPRFLLPIWSNHHLIVIFLI